MVSRFPCCLLQQSLTGRLAANSGALLFARSAVVGCNLRRPDFKRRIPPCENRRFFIIIILWPYPGYLKNSLRFSYFWRLFFSRSSAGVYIIFGRRQVVLIISCTRTRSVSIAEGRAKRAGLMRR